MSAPAGTLLSGALTALEASFTAARNGGGAFAPLASISGSHAAASDQPEPPSRSILAELAERVAAQLTKREPALQLFTSEWLDLPWIVFTRCEGRTFLSFPSVRDGLAQAAFGGPHVTYLARLANAYLEFFDREHLDELRFLGELIVELISITRRRSTFAAHWWERHQEFRFFDPDAAPLALASRLIAPGAPAPAALLDAGGLGGRLGQRGLARAALCTYAGLAYTRGLESLPALAEWQQFSAPGESIVQAEIVGILLQPWRTNAPPAVWRTGLAEWLIRTHGFPEPKSPVWRHVDSELQEVVLRWAPNQAIRLFFDLIAEFADARGHHPVIRHLPDRRRFWEAYAQGRPAPEVKAAFGPEAIAHFGRKRLRKLLGDAYAELRGFGGSQCALFLKFQRLVVMVGTHKARCRFWPVGRSTTPDLSVRRFERAEIIRKPRTDLQVVRDADDTGVVMAPDVVQSGWRARVHDFIREHSGEELPESEYR